MAKLNVKVLDMVDGNVTKVAYDGAEYVRVEGNARVGDIVVNAKKHSDLTVDAYYSVINAYTHGTVRVRDDIGDGHDLGRAGHKAVFRKVSTTTPGSTSIDERVDSLEKRVDALEEKPAPPFKEGDLVVITESKYERGDKSNVGWAKSGQGLMKSGAIGEVISVSGRLATVKFDEDQSTVSAEDFRQAFVLHVEEMRHATPAERQAYEDSLKPAKPKLKAGDYVKFTKLSVAQDDGDITLGKKYKIIECDGNPRFRDDEGDIRGYITLFDDESKYEIVAPPTAFERLGRKEGEFKVGDVVRVIKTGTHHFSKDEVIEIIAIKRTGLNDVEGKRFSDETSGYRPYLYEYEIELIAPVENRVDGVIRGEASCA